MPTCCTGITASCIKYILQHEQKILRLSMHYLQLLDYNFSQLLCRKSSQRITRGRKHSVAVPKRCKGSQTFANRRKLWQMVASGRRWSQTVRNGCILLQMVTIDNLFLATKLICPNFLLLQLYLYTRRQINQDRMIFDDFSVNCESIFLKFCKGHFLFKS